MSTPADLPEPFGAAAARGPLFVPESWRTEAITSQREEARKISGFICIQMSRLGVEGMQRAFYSTMGVSGRLQLLVQRQHYSVPTIPHSAEVKIVTNRHENNFDGGYTIYADELLLDCNTGLSAARHGRLVLGAEADLDLLLLPADLPPILWPDESDHQQAYVGPNHTKLESTPVNVSNIYQAFENSVHSNAQILEQMRYFHRDEKIT